MSDPNFKIETSQRIQRLPPYLFGRINKMKYEKRVAGVDIIDLGMGNPTDPTPDSVIEKLAEAAKDPRNHRYSVSNGVAGLRREVAKKYRDKYGVELDPETEVIATIGSKEGFSHLCLALLGPGDTAVVPDPAFPIHLYAVAMAVFAPDELNWHSVATLATWLMTLFIQRAEHRDTQAIQAKLDELLRSHTGASDALAHVDRKEPEEIERLRGD